MKVFRLLLHSFALALINIVSILCGFVIYHLLRPVNQIAVQVPSAVLLTILIFLTWSLLMRRLSSAGLSLKRPSEFAWVFFLAMLWSPVIFIPLHYIARGYVTSFGNILGLLIFQMPANLLTLLCASRMIRNNEQ